MKLYHSPKAVNSERACNFLKVKGKLDAVEIVEISLMKKEHKTPAFKAISPFSQVPVLVLDDGETITESRAICTYFESVFPEPNLMGVDAREKALIEMWDRRIEWLFLVQFAQWFRNAHPVMASFETPQLPDAAIKGERQTKAFVRRLDKFLEDREWLAAERFSIADLTLYLTCGFCGVMKWKPHHEFEHVGRLHDAVKTRLE